MTVPILIALAGLSYCAIAKLGLVAGIGVVLAVYLLMPYQVRR